MPIAIIDYGAGNLRSVEKAFQQVGVAAEVTKDKNTIRGAKGIVFPGVGSFDAAIKELRALSLEGVIEEAIAMGKPFLGICLGLQTAVIEFARNACSLERANSSEFAQDPPYKVIYKMRELLGVDTMGGTMRHSMLNSNAWRVPLSTISL